MFIEVAKALRVLHSKNIMHRDLKLSNILINDANHVKLIDFGCAVQLQSVEEER